MWGLGPFTYIEFLIRTIVNFVRRIGTDDWPAITAIISKSEQKKFILGFGDVIVIHYKYRNAEKRFEGVHKEPFVFDNYAKAYLHRFPGGDEVSICVSPKNPSRSILANPDIEFIRVK